MNIRQSVRDFIFDSSHFEKLEKITKQILQNQEKLQEQIGDIEKRLADNTRALATLAVVQARLLNEIGHLIDADQKEKEKKQKPRNPGTEFTN